LYEKAGDRDVAGSTRVRSPEVALHEILFGGAAQT
jgi:hypothetical protein